MNITPCLNKLIISRIEDDTTMLPSGISVVENQRQHGRLICGEVVAAGSAVFDKGCMVFYDRLDAKRIVSGSKHYDIVDIDDIYAYVHNGKD